MLEDFFGALYNQKMVQETKKGDAMERLRPYVEKALVKQVTHGAIVETSKVFTAPWVRMKCQFGCFNFGKSRCCPPHTPTPEEMRKILDSYTFGILLHRHLFKGYKIVDDFNEIVINLERTLFLDGYYMAWAIGSGPCTRCKECNIEGPCNYADKARPSMEACGIDVFKTAHEHGMPIKTLKDHAEPRDIYGLVLVE